jgi:hypothetical protein
MATMILVFKPNAVKVAVESLKTCSGEDLSRIFKKVRQPKPGTRNSASQCFKDGG